MHLPRQTLILASIYATGTLADYLGPTYPAPVDLSSKNSLIPAAWSNFTSTLDSYLKNHVKNTKTAPLTGIENTTFSAGLFSIHDPDVEKLQYHWTSPEIRAAKNGTNKVNGDSIYRVASTSKLFTVYAGLLSLTEEEWNRPLTQINPGLAKMTKEKKDPTRHVEWDQITPWALAAQISGIPREGWPAADALYNYTAYALGGLPTEDIVKTWGVPPVYIFKLGKCWNISTVCGAQDVLEAVRSQPPVFLPWSTPMYANDNFVMLGIMMSNITGRSIPEIYQKALFNPLNLTSTFSLPPTSHANLARSVIAGPPASSFLIDIPFAISSGGVFSTTNDLAKLGTSILNNTLLPANVTRKWMKPITHTASLTYSMGAPWEIVRYVHPETGKVTDIYTKLGDSGAYSANLVLIPDYGAGISILSAATAKSRGATTRTVLDYIVNSILPALEAQAAAEATRNYAGTYESTNPHLNSSVTIAFNKSSVATSKSGLSITRWISNGTDVLNSPNFGGGKPKLLPSIPKQTPDGEKGQVAFQASLLPQTSTYFAPEAARLKVVGPFTGQYAVNADWLLADAAHYGGIGVNLFIFDVDGKGKATAVSPAVTRARLEKKK